MCILCMSFGLFDLIFITTQLQMAKLKEIGQQEDKLRVNMFSTMISHISMHTHVCYNYRVALNYGRSRINTWSRLVVRGNSIMAKMNARSFVGPQ